MIIKFILLLLLPPPSLLLLLLPWPLELFVYRGFILFVC